MRLGTFTIAAVAIMALTACDNQKQQNPELLKGQNFIANQEGIDITLSFDKDGERVYGYVTNRYNGAYKADGNKISFGPIISTMMAGDPKMMRVEQEYLRFLATTETYSLNGSNLIIKGQDGKEISFEKIDVLPTIDPAFADVE